MMTCLKNSEMFYRAYSIFLENFNHSNSKLLNNVF